MAALHEACASGKVAAKIAVVIASTESSPALARARELGLRTAVVPVGDDYGDRLVAALKGCDVLCLAGYLRLLPTEVLQAFPNRVLNIHPALLPKFGGKGMYGHHVHEAVIAAGEKVSGCTVHLVTQVYDEGRILVQKECPVAEGDTAGTLAERVLALEHQAFPEALAMVVAELPKATKAKEDKESDLVDLQHPFFTRVTLPFIRVFGWVLMTFLGPYRYRNRRSIPRNGGLLIFSNHRADVDPIAIQMGCPRPIYFMGKSELFEIPVLGWVIRMFRAFSVKRGEPDRAAIKQAVATAQACQVVCVFPEGQLTETGKLQELKPGIALMARMAGVPVICCAVKNTDRVMPYGKIIPRPAFAWVECVWGDVRSFDRHAKTEEILEWTRSELLRLSGEEA
jgi:formyltetrahydrofolate-dependent phosphoribosylglycinamide formyltransferase